MTAATTTVDRAIEDSIREDRTVVLTATVDTQEWVDLVTDLASRADDWVETDNLGTDPVGTGKVREYWGVDEDGDAWRVHVIY